VHYENVLFHVQDLGQHYLPLAMLHHQVDMTSYEEWPKTSVFYVENTPNKFPRELCSKNKKNMDSDAVFLLRKEILYGIRSLHSFTYLLRYNLAVNFTTKLQTKFLIIW